MSFVLSYAKWLKLPGELTVVTFEPLGSERCDKTGFGVNGGGQMKHYRRAIENFELLVLHSAVFFSPFLGAKFLYSW